MECPYCGKAVRDVPNHLAKSPVCSNSHSNRLQADFMFVVATHNKQHPKPAQPGESEGR